MRLISILFIMVLNLFASFEDGKKIFDTKCISCHKEYIPMNLIKENFFEKNNTLLNLKAPSANMIAWAMLESSKKIGDSNEPDFQEIEIENFLKSYLENPNRFNSVCDDSAIDYYDNKASMKGQISVDEYTSLAKYFIEYKENIKEEEVFKKPKYSNSEEENILKNAKQGDKKIIVYATSSSCYFCKKMDKEVFLNSSVKEILNSSYIFLEIDMDNSSLPFNLQKEYKRITPSFFILTNEAKLLTQYPGAWTKKDFIEILKEHK